MPEIGQTVSHYRLVEKIGQGGMGEVYLAEDTTLDRKVALKFLPEAFTSDPERMARFEREAKLLASLNHINIAGIYGLEQDDGNRFLVLEYVEGETLQARLSKGALPLEDALELCRQIAEGLEAAHEKGVIHRDLKPANVMITAEEKVKILDFGLAKALADETQSIDPSDSPTITDAMTRPGVVLGTAAYMSPEQAKGKSVDKRADIWAFGCILYECLTGKKVFEGETVTETLAAILRGDPEWDALPTKTPHNVRFLLQRCLEREKGKRFESASDVRILLEEPLTAISVLDNSILRRIPYSYIAVIIFISLLVGGGITYIWQQLSEDSLFNVGSTYTYIKAPEEVASAFHMGFALSPDGKTLVFSARTEEGTRQLWKRQLGQTHSQPIPRTEDGTHPFWSPDGRNIAFFVPNQLRRIPVNGGNIQVICSISSQLNVGSWGENDVVLFTGFLGGDRVLFKVPANSGTREIVKTFDDSDVYAAQWLPGGRHFLFSRVQNNSSVGIFVTSIDSTMVPKLVVEFNSDIQNYYYSFLFSPPDHLLFNKSGALTIQRFDTKTLSVTGQAVPLTGLVGTPLVWFAITAANDRAAMFARDSTNDSGNPGDPLTRLTWLNRKGDKVGTLGPVGRHWTLHLSPDGQRVATNPSGDIWVYDTNNPSERITSSSLHDDIMAAWSPDGNRIVFSRRNIPIVKPVTQEGQEEQLIMDSNLSFWTTDWSRDGRYLLGISRSTKEFGGGDIWVYDFEEKSCRPWLPIEFDEISARFSPNGKWVAYASDKSGSYEIYVRPFEGTGDHITVSSGGGLHPIWSVESQELFFLRPNGELMVVDTSKLYTESRIDKPQSLFRIPLTDITNETLSPYDVSPDGQMFLVNWPEPPEPLLFIQGLEELLQRGQ